MSEKSINNTLNREEIDAIGEIGNISMGTAATTLSTVLSKKVTISTPDVEITTMAQLIGSSNLPYLITEVTYTEGLEGKSVFVLNIEDVKIITDIMMGGEGVAKEGDLGELELSAIGEIMNQMIGSSATAMSSMLQKTVQISPPESRIMTLKEEAASADFSQDTNIAKTSFALEIDGCLKSEFLQVLPLNFAKDMADGLLFKQDTGSGSDAEPVQEKKAEPAPAQEQKAEPAPNPTPVAPAAPAVVRSQNVVNIGSPHLPSLESVGQISGVENIDLVINVPIQVSIELGRTKKTIKEILELKHGSLIVLERLAGDMVDIVVNGKLMAKGEVIVIDDNYGVRVTDIVKLDTGVAI